MAPLVGLLAIVTVILVASRRPRLQPVFRWLPIPLWCYGLPMLARTAGWLPSDPLLYHGLIAWLLPVALGLLLAGLDLGALRRLGPGALQAMAFGMLGVIAGGPCVAVFLRAHLPPDAWAGIGTLAATWTGGSLNMLAVQAILDVPQEVFGPLVVVDTIVAYSWMTVLMAAKGLAPVWDRWVCRDQRRASAWETAAASASAPVFEWKSVGIAILSALALSASSRWLAGWLPVGVLVASANGWTILLVTTVALAASSHPAIRAIGRQGPAVGYPCLYLVLAALGAQASVRALLAMPIWLVVGIGMVGVHAAVLLAAGRVFRLPLGVLATASQANLGGVVSAPMVGAVYHRSLAPVGLLLALAGNAIGSYLGWATAWLSRLALGAP